MKVIRCFYCRKPAVLLMQKTELENIGSHINLQTDASNGRR